METADYLFTLWEGAEASLKAIKALESRLRDDLTKQLLAGERPDATGTFNFYVCDREITVTVSQGITVDEAEYDINVKDFTDAEKAAVKFRPTLVKTEFNKLPKESVLRALCAIVKPGKPSIKIVS